MEEDRLLVKKEKAVETVFLRIGWRNTLCTSKNKMFFASSHLCALFWLLLLWSRLQLYFQNKLSSSVFLVYTVCYIGIDGVCYVPFTFISKHV